MDARTRLEAEFEREAAETEAALLLKLLRARTRELTLGDLHALLESPHGARLHGHRLGELLSSAGGAVRAAAPPSGEEALQALLAAVQRSDGPVTPRELARIDTSFDRCDAQLDVLVTVGLLEALGDPPHLRFQATPEAASKPRVPVLVLAALLLTILRRTGRRMQLIELRRTSGCSEERVRRALHHLKRIGAVTCTGQNSGTRYGIADAAPHATH